MDHKIHQKIQVPGKITFPYIITLSEPVVVQGHTYPQITFRAPKGRDWRKWGMQPEDPKRTYGLLCDLAEVPEEVFDELPMAEHQKALAVADLFFGTYRPLDNDLVKSLTNSPGFMDGLMQMLRE